MKFHQKSTQINENRWKSMKIHENRWQLTTNHANLWKSTKHHKKQWKLMKINENQWKSPRDAHGGQNGSTGFEYWTTVGFVNLICFAMLCYTLLC